VKKRKYHRKAVRRGTGNRGIWSRSIVWGLFLILFIALGHIWQRVTLLELSQDVKDLKGQLSEVQKKYKYLNIEIAALGSVQRIESIALGDLSLTYPQAEKIVYLSEPLICSRHGSADSFVLWDKFKELAHGLISITEERLEAKEIKHDL
jgi:cell division protein FtsL